MSSCVGPLSYIESLDNFIDKKDYTKGRKESKIRSLIQINFISYTLIFEKYFSICKIFDYVSCGLSIFFCKLFTYWSFTPF